ncbi:MAG: hypothetical protein KJO24_06720, partial [Gammaproteobacteria bacterium]|nr:hypothetical protein [Gammaproteobacteria bacterium]
MSTHNGAVRRSDSTTMVQRERLAHCARVALRQPAAAIYARLMPDNGVVTAPARRYTARRLPTGWHHAGFYGRRS